MNEKYATFEAAFSIQRLSRYQDACNNNVKLTIMLYELNSFLSVSLFRSIGIFEVTLRNSIDKLLTEEFGKSWIEDSISSNGIFRRSPSCKMTCKAIRATIDKLKCEIEIGKRKSYSHSDIVSKLEFGFWKYQFAAPQFTAANKMLLKIFPDRPISTKEIKYNNTYFYKKLDELNELRNRIAHHEPVCFEKYKPIIDTQQAERCIDLICTLLNYMKYNHNYLIGDYQEMKYLIAKINQIKRITN